MCAALPVVSSPPPWCWAVGRTPSETGLQERQTKARDRDTRERKSEVIQSLHLRKYLHSRKLIWTKLRQFISYVFMSFMPYLGYAVHVNLQRESLHCWSTYTAHAEPLISDQILLVQPTDINLVVSLCVTDALKLELLQRLREPLHC